ncbi:MAG: salicylate synthase [Firmicutes bacterium]|nr:salicylate synthase [Bacillota bacterium]
MKDKKYYEARVSYLGSDHNLAVEICDKSTEKEYMLYENIGEISIGIGVYTKVIAKPKVVFVEREDKKESVAVNDLAKALEQSFSLVGVEKWRAYGMGNFGLARVNNGLPLGDESDILLKLFIPEVEYRINSETVLIRALSQEKLEQEIRRIEKFIEEINSKPSYKDINNKLAAEGFLLRDADYYKDIVTTGVSEIKESKYQKVILSRKIPLEKALDMSLSYLKERKVNTPARSYMLRLDNLEVIGFSPETVAEVDKDGNVSTFPLAGTRALLNNEAENKRLKEELLNDPKEIAEHAVSVKLAYEELKEVCNQDSVVVSDFMSVLERGTVQHIASRLKGKLKVGYNSWHAFNKLFPSVTASGIPKKESIEAIGRIEKDARDLYSGSVLTYDENGSLDAALVLRTIFQNNTESWLRVGAGIVEMSKPERELEETCEKLRSFSQQLIYK